ncbi:MAG: hypothetical protein IPL09_09955 [Bacteroidetes bacterium]|jgi:ABC-type multidrug transport system fused ATPase/permease subunit|nr:hypothetical protein [Bacteroidota bacterium]HMT36489.1 hypothetical protein [Chitinophagaceae bacterium]MBK6819819.1 hypothetical protein [Bacteroidota bacterium]MBK7039671.1 hypothetical protein [Bacteroidota bacterium]MBK7587469.1 hypothetical protein [Bacteroidota bacterium]
MMFSSNKKTPHDAPQQISDAQQLLSTLQPALDHVYSNKATLWVSKSFDWIEEFLYYLIASCCFVFIFIMDSIFPFHLLGEIVNRPVFREQISNANDINSFNLAVKGLIVIIGILFILLGIKKRVIRRNKTLIYNASVELKKVEKHLLSKIDELSKLPPETVETTSLPNTTI